MNGRLYDPLVGRFLSSDPYVQNAGFTQNYNRYSYCLNNPLKYTDPTGNQIYNYGVMESITGLLTNTGRGGGGGGGSNTPHIDSWYADGSMPGSYSYNDYTGKYTDYFGNGVPFNDVFNNYITPNGASASAIIFSGTKNDPYQTFRGIHYSDGTSWYVGDNTSGPYGQGGVVKTTLNNINEGLNAVGIFAGSAELFTNANAGARITYTTINGISATVSSAKVATAFKVAGTYTFYGSIAVDVVLSFAGSQSWGKTLVNTTIGGVAIAVGGIPGLVIGVGYTVLDKTGMFDRPAGPMPYYTPGFAVPDATRVAAPIIKY